MFFLKFHCSIERVWAQAKRYIRAHCIYLFNGLLRTVAPALDSAIRKYFQKARDYMYITAYREGHVPGCQLLLNDTNLTEESLKLCNSILISTQLVELLILSLFSCTFFSLLFFPHFILQISCTVCACFLPFLLTIYAFSIEFSLFFRKHFLSSGIFKFFLAESLL